MTMTRSDNKPCGNPQGNPRIARAFARARAEQRAALIPYIAAGDPTLAATVSLMHALARAGADVIELGVPFSDPSADGPVVQRATARALANGVGLASVLDRVAQFRADDTETPVVLMGYANPVERMGQATFAERAGAAGVDGWLGVDCPPDEMAELNQHLQRHNVDMIFLLAPTSTPARIEQVAQVARGYVYYVSLNGVTGAAHLDTEDVAQRVQAVRARVPVPVGVGFGIRDAQSAQQIARVADAVVIGSKLIETWEAALAAHADSEAAIAATAAWLAGIRQAMNTVASQA